MVGRKEILELFNYSKIPYEITEHIAVYNMHEVSKLDMPYPEADAKNLFIRDDKKEQYFLITVHGEKRVDLKTFRKRHNTRPLTFASEDDLQSILGLTQGAVTPFGLLNDVNRRVVFYLDDYFLNPPGLIGIHPNENTSTLWIKTEDLLSIIREHGNEIYIVNFKELYRGT